MRRSSARTSALAARIAAAARPKKAEVACVRRVHALVLASMASATLLSSLVLALGLLCAYASPAAIIPSAALPPLPSSFDFAFGKQMLYMVLFVILDQLNV